VARDASTVRHRPAGRLYVCCPCGTAPTHPPRSTHPTAGPGSQRSPFTCHMCIGSSLPGPHRFDAVTRQDFVQLAL
jgi:hypothetical protein